MGMCGGLSFFAALDRVVELWALVVLRSACLLLRGGGGSPIFRKAYYDALFAFSEGAGLVVSLLVSRARLKVAGVGVGHLAGCFEGLGADLPMIRCAVFSSARVSRDLEKCRLMNAAVDGEVIDVPTAHMWDDTDNLGPSFGPVLSRLCKANMKEATSLSAIASASYMFTMGAT